MINLARSGSNTVAVGDYWRLVLEWSAAESNVANNTTDVTARLYWESTHASGSVSSTATKTGYITIDGTTFTFSGAALAALSGAQKKLIYSITKTVPHNTDGSKSLVITGVFDMAVTLSGVYYSSKSVSLTATLDAIQRATTPVLSNSAFTMGQSITISTPRNSGDYTHTLVYVFGNQTVNIAFDVATSYTWSVPLTMANAIPNAVRGLGSVVCHTYRGTTLIGSRAVNFTADVPTTVKPTITSTNVVEAEAGITAKFGAYVQSKSKLNLSMVGAGAYSSTIVGSTITVDDVVYNSHSVITDVLRTSGTLTITYELTDSRGRTTSVTRNITVLPYSNPTIRTPLISRVDAAGELDDEGNRVKVTLYGAIAATDNKNDKAFTLQYRQVGTDAWEDVNVDNSSYMLDTVIFVENINVDYAYEFAFEVADYFTSVNASYSVSTAFTLVDYHRGGRGLAFGKVAEREGLEVALPTDFTTAPTVAGQNLFGRVVSIEGDGATVVAQAVTAVGFDNDDVHSYQVLIKDANNNLYIGVGVFKLGTLHKTTKIAGELGAIHNNYGTISPTGGTAPYTFSFNFYY